MVDRGLDAGIYTLRVLADRPYEQEIDLKSGDRLIVDLVDDGNGGIAFRRALYGDDDDFQGAENRQQGGDWRLTVLGDQKTGRQDRRSGADGGHRIDRDDSGPMPWSRSGPGGSGSG